MMSRTDLGLGQAQGEGAFDVAETMWIIHQLEPVNMMQYGGGYGGDLPPMNTGPSSLPLHQEFPCVKLRGLPFDANEEDVRMFLVSLINQSDENEDLAWGETILASDRPDGIAGARSNRHPSRSSKRASNRRGLCPLGCARPCRPLAGKGQELHWEALRRGFQGKESGLLSGCVRRGDRCRWRTPSSQLWRGAFLPI